MIGQHYSRNPKALLGGIEARHQTHQATWLESRPSDPRWHAGDSVIILVL